MVRMNWSCHRPISFLQKAIEKHPNAGVALRCLGSSPDKLRQLLEADKDAADKRAKKPFQSSGNRGDTEDRMGGIDSFCIDFTAQARDGKLETIHGRDDEIRKMIAILLRRSKGNPLLIGEPGSGREWFVQQMATALTGTEDAHMMIDGKDFVNSRVMTDLNAFLLRNLDGFVAVRGIPSATSPAYEPFCEFVEEGMIPLAKGKRKNGFNCSVVLIADSEDPSGIGFSNGGIGTEDATTAFQSLTLDDRLKSIFRADQSMIFTGVEQADAEDVIRIELAKLPAHAYTTVDPAKVIERCADLTVKTIIDQLHKIYEEEFEFGEEMRELFDNPLGLDSLTA